MRHYRTLFHCKVEIKLVSVRGVSDSGTGRQVQSLLEHAELHPDGLAPSTIAIVLKLSDPQPEMLRLTGHDVHPRSAWERAVKDSLQQKLRSAARPALGAVPANAGAVLFVDQSELLASLATDWCDGSVLERWWWRSIFKLYDVKKTVQDAWLEDPEYVPAALEGLSRTGKMASFLTIFDAGQARALVTLLATKFALPDVAAAAAQLFGNHDAAVAASPPATRMDERAAPDGPGSPPEPPWRRWVSGDVERGLALEQTCLLGLGLSLVRAPAAVRSPWFAGSLLKWGLARKRVEGQAATTANRQPKRLRPQESTSGSNRDSLILKVDSATVVETPLHEQAPGPPVSLVSPEHRENRTAPRQTEPRQGVNTTEPQPHKDTGTDSADVRPRQELPSHPKSAAPGAAGGTTTSVQLTRTARDDRALQTAPDSAASVPLGEPVPIEAYSEFASSPTFPALVEEELDSELAGLLYLINVGIFLGLYGDFTSPSKPGISLSIWDFLSLSCRGLKAGGPQEDPLLPLLARLAGRRQLDEAGAYRDPPESWRVPEEWLLSFPEPATWRWMEAGDRLRVQHPEGFLVLDLPLQTDGVMSQLARVTAEYQEVVPFTLEEVGFEVPSPASPLDRWLGWLLPYLRARLGRALNVENDAAFDFLCRRSARVQVTPTHLDVFFALDDHPLEIRMAGLDRNPGWVPAAGRYIAFHYN